MTSTTARFATDDRFTGTLVGLDAPVAGRRRLVGNCGIWASAAVYKPAMTHHLRPRRSAVDSP